MDPLKAAAAAAFCLVLFWLAFRLTRRLVDLAIAAGRAEERRRAAEEAEESGGIDPPQAAGAARCAAAIRITAASLTTNADGIPQGAIDTGGASPSSVGIAQEAPARGGRSSRAPAADDGTSGTVRAGANRAASW